MKPLRYLTMAVSLVGLAMLFTGLVIEEAPSSLAKWGTALLIGALAVENWQVARHRVGP